MRTIQIPAATAVTILRDADGSLHVGTFPSTVDGEEALDILKAALDLVRSHVTPAAPKEEAIDETAVSTQP